MGKFLMHKTATGIKFDLKARNGEIIATSEVYNSEDACRNGIASVQRNAPVAGIEDQTTRSCVDQKNPKFVVFKDKAGAFRFHLTATNGQIIAVSEAYTVKKSCLNGIASVRKNAPDAPIIEE